MKFFVLFLTVCFLAFSSKGQNRENNSSIPLKSISGQILDTNSLQNLEFVSIRVFSQRDSSVVGGALSDSSGKFVVSNIKAKRVFIKISCVGYETKTISNLQFQENIPVMSLGKISLSSSIQNLDEVKVVGQLDVFKTGIDKKIYNLGEDLNTQGGSASDVLNNIPSIDVDQDGNISLRGDGGVIVLIDGRPSTLTLNGALEGLPANSIERIEVVTNPSAKYDPDGTSGIINIVLKKAKLRGVNGIVSATYGTGNSFNGTASVNIRTSKINVFANYAYRYNEGYRNYNGELTRTTSSGNTVFNQERPGTHLRRNQNLRMGMDYFISENQSIGFAINGSLGYQNRYSELNNTFYDVANSIQDNWVRHSTDISDGQNLDINVNYQNELKNNKGEISAGITSSFGNDEKQGNYDNAYFIDNYSESNELPLYQQLINSQNDQVTTGQIDYSKTFEKYKARIETGVKGIYRKEELDTKSQTLNNSLGLYQEDTLANFRYNYSEQIYSIYGIWGQQVGKFKYQVGLRGEYAQQIPFLIDDNLKINNDYYNFFPSGHLRYDLKKKRELSLSYSRRIDRAGSRQLNPFTDYSDPLNLRVGNPYLTPEYINSFDLGYMVELNKLVFTSSVFYRHSTDVIQRVKVFYSDNVTATTYGNIDESNSYGFEMVLNYNPIKIWRNTLSINGDRIEFVNSSGESNFNNSGYNLGIKFSSTIDFWKKTATFQTNVRYNTPRITAQGKVLPRAAVDISGSKKLNSNWSVGFRISDLFNTQGFQFDFQQDNVRQTGDYKWLTRRFYFTLTYKFGKLEVGKKEGRNSEGDGGGFDF
jgi:outer membrane receptor protein involved in Fe transport